ncbi:MAG: DUF3301 domain-containing protein [Pseudomonadota bacterium]|nr:DUF3301 domain-containing protein [Pseudomonadota bacterium]
MSEILGLAFLLLVIFIWYRNLTVRELAMMHSSKACKTQGFQLLDGSVHLSGMGLTRCPDQRRCLRRKFRFSYSSDHVHRSNGVVIMLGDHLESIVFSSPPKSLEA